MPKTVLITGCGPTGIGAALATEFHMRGHKVFASGLSPSLLEHFQSLQIETLVLDVTSSSSIDAAVAHVAAATHGTLDILINNAGIVHIMPLTDTDIEDVRKVFEVNVIGAFAVTRAFSPLLIAAAAAGGANSGGHQSVVASIGSINEVLRPSFFSSYNASKAAVEAFGGTIRTELAPLGVRVVTVKTGSVRSDLFRNAPPSKLPADSLYQPLREHIEERRMLENVEFTAPEEYAERVVSELLKPTVKPVIWAGSLTTMAWLLWCFGWEGILDKEYITRGHLDRIRR